MRRYTVRQLTDELTALLQGRYPALEVEGEITQVATPGSGHAYFTLRDGDAVLGCVCWRDTWRGLKERPAAGTRVVARGKLGVYGGKGAYQLYVHDLAPAGEGAWAAELARRKAALEAEGLLDPRRKRPLPRFPRFVGVATSLTGAALQDFLKVSGQRWPAARILVAGCMVQGPQAAPSVVMAVDRLLLDGRSEVIVVTRGGGSKEDLLAFQDVGLARHLAHSPVPVVSAVGHQVDTTLADLVADVIAPTPTAAAVLVLPDGPALAQRVDEAALALQGVMRRLLQLRRREVVTLQARTRHPRERLVDARRRGRALEERLQAALARRLPAARDRVVRLTEQRDRLLARRLERSRDRVDLALARAQALSPQSVLARGYAVLMGPDGVVTQVAQAQPGLTLSAQVADGRFEVVVAPREPVGG